VIAMLPSSDAPGGRPSRSPRAHDPEFDQPRAPRPVLYEIDPREFQRLVLNPFLFVLALLAWFALTRFALYQKQFSTLLVAQTFLVAAYFLIQFHCLDCGATSRLSRWERHACERVVARQLADRPRRFRWPNPMIQLTLWFYVLLAVFWLAIVSR